MILFYIIRMITKYTRSQLEALPKRKLIDINLEQQEMIVHLENTVTQFKSTITRLENTIPRLEERIRQLEGQLHKDSHNSHIPPSQSYHPIKNLREPSGKEPGGQPGHPGYTLALVDKPNQILTCPVTRCLHCGKDLSQIPVTSYERHQVFDLPPLKMEVTEYRIEKKICACGTLNIADYPTEAQAPVQYGINTQTLVCLLSSHGFMGQERISETMEYLLGHRLSEGTICALQEKLSNQLAGFEERSKQELIQSPVIHVDETGVRVEGAREWAHVTSTAETTHYNIDPQRGKAAMDRIGILPKFHGRAVHDRWQAYFKYDQPQHSLCNEHNLRDLTFFEEEEKAAWALSFKEHLLEGKDAVEAAKRADKDHLEPEFWQAYSRHYDEILEGAQKKLPPPVRTGKRGKVKKSAQQNFIESMLTLKEAVLRFMSDFRVPFTNNLAESDLRMFKVKGKVSGTFRSRHGAECFARIRGYISTVRKNGANVYQEVRHALLGKPFLLTKWRIGDQFLKFLLIPNIRGIVLSFHAQ
jgi:transposase